ncbi:unnamed protein product [Musa acuminata subsp. malaccensis]|nr:unnamed protein product [Musa acuminata subsp. malaccensis]
MVFHTSGKFFISQNVGACYTILLEILRCMVFSMQLHLDLLKLVQVKIQPWLALECPMEGIEQNPVVYDLMSEMAFHHKPVDVKIWVDLYATRRYGRSVPTLQDAWQILYHTLYNCTDGAYVSLIFVFSIVG